MSNVKLYFDGGLTVVDSSRRLYIGYHIVSDQQIAGKTSHVFGIVLDENPDIPMTAIAAEYGALLAGLDYLLNNGYTGPINVYGDSTSVINQINGTAKCGKSYITGLRDAARSSLSKFKDYTVTWIPREENKEADAAGKATAYALASASIAKNIVSAINAPENNTISLPMTITPENFLKTAAEKRLIRNYRKMTPVKQRALEALTSVM